MNFTEKMQAFIVARYYVRLTDTFGEQGRLAFRHGTQYYGTQRGRRMAQRAIRDGVTNLTYEVYCQYGEWVNTEECKKLGCANKTTILAKNPDVVRQIDICPWNTQFREMGRTDAGDEYCQYIDKSICRGFNPDLVYEVKQTLNTSDCCLHVIPDANFTDQTDCTKKMQYVRDFEFHCAHSYWSYREVVSAIFASTGERLAAAVLSDFEQEYGKEMADRICKYRDTNFNICNE